MIFEEGGKVSIVTNKDQYLGSEPDLFSNVQPKTVDRLRQSKMTVKI
jgi:hypothetical protein